MLFGFLTKHEKFPCYPISELEAEAESLTGPQEYWNRSCTQMQYEVKYFKRKEKRIYVKLRIFNILKGSVAHVCRVFKSQC